jgi:hypothetical protein
MMRRPKSKRDWKRVVRRLLAQHPQLRSSKDGDLGKVRFVGTASNTVLHVDNLYFKFYTADPLHLERETLGLRCAESVALPVARTLLKGSLTFEDKGPDVPFLVTAQLGEACVRDVAEQLSVPDMMAVASFLGSWLRKLHGVGLSAEGLDPAMMLAQWNHTLMLRRGSVLSGRGAGSYLRKCLSPSARAQLEDYLPRASLVTLLRENGGDTPVLLHGDLNDENVVLKQTAWGAWYPVGVLDLGDCVTVSTPRRSHFCICSALTRAGRAPAVRLCGSPFECIPVRQRCAPYVSAQLWT